MNYSEERILTKEYKKEYADGIENIIRQRQKEFENVRREYRKNIFSNQQKYRDEFINMLGWPLVGYDKSEEVKYSSEKISDEEGYSIYRMRFEILEGLQLTGLFFKADGDEKKPMVIVQHGGHGTPELISGVYGDTANYNDMLQRVRKYGVHIFAPQLLLWHEDYEVPYNRVEIDARLKRVGSSITAIEIFGIMRVIDFFEKESYVSKFGMVGLSYGGFYTLFTSAVDTRIKSAISCSFFASRDSCGWCDWTWLNSAEKFDDAEIACLSYPRRLCLQMGNDDELFDYKESLASFERIKELAHDVGTDWIDLIVFDGKHEFYKEDAPIERLVNDLKK